MEGLGGANSLCLVVPCFNEARRLPRGEVEDLASTPGISLVLVDDGSTDSTLETLRSIAASRSSVMVLPLPRNRGKGEAVRAGLVRARQSDAGWVGYLDADLSTSGAEILRLFALASSDRTLDVVIGSRVALLGRDIRRSPFRHVTGRVFATLASIVLRLPVYDTQCGAKLLRVSAALDHALSQPFRSRWAFDVELLGRMGRAGVAPSAFWEEPLSRWVDIGGSRRSVSASVRSTFELFPVARDLSRWSPP